MCHTCLAVEANRQYDDGGLGDQRDSIRDTVGKKRVAHELNDKGAEQRSDDGRPPSGQEGSADRDRRDRVSSIPRPTRLASAAEFRAITMRPASPDKRPLIA